CSTIFHNLPPPTHLYSLSLHDALPIYSDDPLHGEPRLTGVVGLRITVLPGLHMPVHSWVEEHQYEPTDGEQNEHVRECHDKAFRGVEVGTWDQTSVIPSEFSMSWRCLPQSHRKALSVTQRSPSPADFTTAGAAGPTESSPVVTGPLGCSYEIV